VFPAESSAFVEEPAPPPVPDAKPDVTAAEFAAVDMRVGKIVDVQPFPEARRPAWKITVDFGPVGVRRTSARVTSYGQTELIGRLVIGAINLGSRRIAGFRSEFLLLGAVGPEGDVRLLSPDSGAAPGDPVA
jgi:tRNA-binding protein